MSGNLFQVETNLIDRNDLNIYEKMCSVVLARYAGRSEFSNMLSLKVIALRMGCSEAQAEKALNSLIEKKLVMLEDSEKIEPELLIEPAKVNSKVIRSESVLASEPKESPFKHLESFEDDEVKPQKKKRSSAKKPSAVKEEKQTPAPATAAHESEKVTKPPKAKAKEKQGSDEELEVLKAVQNLAKTARPVVPKQAREGLQDLIDQVFEIVEENINDREARIILSFAGNDIELIKEKYRIAKRSQVSDKIEMLINELQKKDDGSIDMPQRLDKAQVDFDNLNRMVALKHNSYGKNKV